MKLEKKKCKPCEGGMKPLKGGELQKYLKEVDSWKVQREHHIVKLFKFKDFKQALSFTNEVGGLAEKEGHHPDILLAWGKVVIKLWTHAIWRSFRK